MLINEMSAARRPKFGGGGAPIPKIGGGASKLSVAVAAAARRNRRRAVTVFSITCVLYVVIDL